MEKHIITEQIISEFYVHLHNEEKSRNTIEKYIRDVRAFAHYMKAENVSKDAVIAYKSELLAKKYAIRSINSMLASINSLFSYLGWTEYKVKAIKLQQQIYCPEEKELTKNEYIRLVNVAKQNGNERLSLILQTICATGIRISELRYITVEAIRKGEVVVTLKGKTRLVFIVRHLQKKLLEYAIRKKSKQVLFLLLGEDWR